MLTAAGSVGPVLPAGYEVLLQQPTVLQLCRKFFALILIHLWHF